MSHRAALSRHRRRGAVEPRGGAPRRRVVARLRSGPRAVAAAGLAETAAVSAPRGLAHNLVYLIYSIKCHGRFCHLLAIVVDFLKIEKVELPSFGKGKNPPRKHQDLEFLLPETACFHPVPPAARVGRFAARRQFWSACSLTFLAPFLSASRSLCPSPNSPSNHPHTTALLFFRCPLTYEPDPEPEPKLEPEPHQ